MDIYEKKYNWKIVLAILGIVILSITLFYANYLAGEVKEKDNLLVSIYQEAILTINKDSSDTGDDFGFTSSILTKYQEIGLPLILIDESEEIFSAYSFDSIQMADEEYLWDRIEKFEKAGLKPMEGVGYAKKIYYFDTPLYTAAKYFPIVQVLLVAIFIALGYYLFSTARKAEQNRVWAGMAKETAHQLGTPISAILAWIEFLKEGNEDRPDQMEIINELRNDVTRLELVADRFSKIGSAPKLEPINLEQELDKCKDYMQRRAPKRVNFTLKNLANQYTGAINIHLFDWVVENLYRNALDSMGGEGVIETTLYEENEYVCIDIKDCGKGIPANKFKTVFEPGYSTKTRGWGLGLSLAKRIIENYHNGKIFVKSSTPNEGTVFSIKLPKAA